MILSYEKRMVTLPTEIRADETGDAKYIEAYFAVFGDVFKYGRYSSEQIEPGAFTDTLQSDDIRALINHDTTLVLGRNRANTLELREDAHGLWGRVKINDDDTDAVNAWQRTKRGDVSQCSIGMQILEETREVKLDDTIVYHVNKVRLFEVSLCTFPAYEATSAIARDANTEDAKKRELDAFLEIMKRRIEKWR